MFELIQEIVYKITGTKDITYDTDFLKDLALSSFDIVNIVCAFEERLDITVPTRDIWHMRQVKDVITYMEERGICVP